MTNSTASKVLEALGGDEYWVRVYQGLRKSGDTKAMSEMIKFLKSYAGASNGAGAAAILKRLEASRKQGATVPSKKKKRTVKTVQP